jgi:CRP-like cAMP-binding protein
VDVDATGWRGSADWFAGLPESVRVDLEHRGQRRSYRAGSTLFHEGDASDWVILIDRGRVKVTCATAEGREVVLAVRVPGELIGELSAIDGHPRSATGTAIDPVGARVIAANDFRDFLGAHPSAALALLTLVSARLRVSDRRNVEFVALDSVGRVAQRLLELGEQFGVRSADGSVRIDVPITQDELAGWTGSSREAVGKALQALRNRGWITTGRRSVTIIDVEGVRSRTS